MCIKKHLKKHLKKVYIMSLTVDKQNIERECRKDLRYESINLNNIHKFDEQDFIHPSLLQKGRYIGAFLEENPVAFACVAKKGEKGDFFDVLKSDLYLYRVYVFKQYRGNGIVSDLISCCIKDYFPENKSVATISLAVRPDNRSAIRCYTKYGFKRIGVTSFIRIMKDYSFPRRKI